MTNTIINTIKAGILLFIALFITRWILQYFGFSLASLQNPETQSYDAALIVTALTCVAIGYSVGHIVGYVIGKQSRGKCKLIHADRGYCRGCGGTRFYDLVQNQ